MSVNKKCGKCQKLKPLEDFYKNRSKPLGVRDECKICHKVYLSSDAHREVKTKHRSSNKYKETTTLYSKSKEFKESQRRYRNKQYKNSEIYRIVALYRARLKKFLLQRSTRKSTNTMLGVVGCSKEFLSAYLESRFSEMHGFPLPDRKLLNIDHIVPLCTANTEEDVIKLSHYTNLQWLLIEDNKKKGSTYE